MHQTASQGLRGGGREIRWTCRTCGHTVKLLDAWGRVVVVILAVLLGAAVPWAAFTHKIQRESERPWIVLVLLATVALLVGLLLHDRAQRARHAIVRADA